MLFAERRGAPPFDAFRTVWEGHFTPHAGRTKMPQLLDIVFAVGARDIIDDDHQIRLLKFDPAAVCESAVAALGFQDVSRDVCVPGEHAHLRMVGPAEWAAGVSLIPLVNANGVVCFGSPKPIAASRLASVCVAPGIDDNFFVAAAGHDAE